MLAVMYMVVLIVNGPNRCERMAYTAGVNKSRYIYTSALLAYVLFKLPDNGKFIQIVEDGSWWWVPVDDAIADMRNDLKRFERDIATYTSTCGERFRTSLPEAIRWP